MTTTEPGLFPNAYAALLFAYNLSGQGYDRPLMNRLAAPVTSKGTGISGLDAIAQAGMIRLQAQRLGRLQEAIVIARTAPHAVDCECKAICCSGKKPNKEWTDAISFLADHIRTTALAGCTSNGMLRREYVIRYFAKKEHRVTVESLAKKYSIDRNTVSAHAGRVNTLFGGRAARKVKDDYVAAVPGLESVTLNDIEELLRASELIG